MNGKFLDEVTEEKDLGVIMQSDLKCSIVSVLKLLIQPIGFWEWLKEQLVLGIKILFCNYLSHWLDHI